MNISKKTWIVLLVIIGLLILTLIFINLNKNEISNPVNEAQNNSGEVTTQNITKAKQGNVEVTDVLISSDGTQTSVTGQVTNNDTKSYSMVEISVIFYGTDNVVLSTAKGLIENLQPEDKKGFSSSITGNFSNSSKYEVKIDKAE